MKDIAIFGFGGLGREVACILNAINKIKPTWNLIGYFDYENKIGMENKYGKVIGAINDLNLYPNYLSVVIAIASPSKLKQISNEIINPNISFPNIIAPDVLYFDKESINIGKGNILGFGVRLSCNVTIGDFNIFNGCVSLGHDVEVGNYNVMQPEVRVSGETIIKDENFFGVKSIVLQGLKIGSNTRIGVGSVIMRKTKDGMLYMGNPAKIVKM